MSSRMFCTFVSVLLLFFVVLTTVKSEESLSEAPAQSERIRSPMLEVLVHLPPDFRDVDSFKTWLGINPTDGNAVGRNVVDVRTYEIAQPKGFGSAESKRILLPGEKVAAFKRRTKREDDKPAMEKPAPQQLVSSLTEAEYKERGPLNPGGTMPDSLRSPAHATYPEGREDISQRDKRTFLEGSSSSGYSGETTTPLPFWKRKKENPPFITGRGSVSQKGTEYTPAQHRSSSENARESHSLKSPEKPIRADDVGRSSQDSYYSPSNRRTYSRQFDAVVIPTTPKSVYDMLDRGQNKKHIETGSIKKQGPEKPYIPDRAEPPREGGGPTHEQYTNRRPNLFSYPSYGSPPRYQPPPYPAEVIGRGTEYYHRTVDPVSGRIIYYADMPERGRSFDHRFPVSIDRSYHPAGPYYDRNNRNFVPPYDNRNFIPPPSYDNHNNRNFIPLPSYDNHNNRNFIPPPSYDSQNNRNFIPPPSYDNQNNRNFIPPPSYDHRFSPPGFGIPMSYARGGRSNSQAFSQSHQAGDFRYQRDPRFVGGYDVGNHHHHRAGDVRNKTYIIYDADEVGSRNGRNPQLLPAFANTYPPPSNKYQGPQEPFRRFPPSPPADYFSHSGFPFRNRIHPGAYWDLNQRGPQPEGRWQQPTGNPSPRPLNSPEVQLPLSTPLNRNTDSSRDFDKSHKA